MGNSLRCCLACVLPCGSFDVVRIVHLSGHIEEYARPVTAGEVMSAHPSHVLSRPCSQGGVRRRRLLIVSPGSELKRGCFYFLVLASSVPEKKIRKPAPSRAPLPPQAIKARPRLSSTKTVPAAVAGASKAATRSGGGGSVDSYLAEVLSEGKASYSRRRRSVRATVWWPHLQSIPEEVRAVASISSSS